MRMSSLKQNDSNKPSNEEVVRIVLWARMNSKPKGTASYQVQLNSTKIVLKIFGSEAVGDFKMKMKEV